jgi:hypothetical protein
MSISSAGGRGSRRVGPLHVQALSSLGKRLLHAGGSGTGAQVTEITDALGSATSEDQIE